MYFIFVILFTSAIPCLRPARLPCRIPLIPDLLVNKKAFQLNANRPLAHRGLEYIVNRSGREAKAGVGDGPNVGGGLGLSLQVNTLEHVMGVLWTCD